MTSKDPYQEGTEESWRETIERHLATKGNSTVDKQAYVPSPNEIRYRAAFLRWMMLWGFPDNFITSVMQFDCPEPQAIVDLIVRKGFTPYDVYKLYLPLLCSKEDFNGND